MRPAVIGGARPNFMKVAPLMRVFAERGIEADLVHTGQHYDENMSASFFRDLGLDEPTVNLAVGSGSHATQTAQVMIAFEAWLDGRDNDLVVVVGDVNSTVACTLVAAKLDLPVAHVEAGLRSFDRTMPEEINRVVVDALAHWLLTPSADADENLRAEGVGPERIFRVGNVMVDSLLANRERALTSDVLDRLDLEAGHYVLVTLHRPALVDDPERLGPMLATLAEFSDARPVVFPVHPRTRARISDFGLAASARRLVLTDPVSYLDFLRLEADARVAVTDSGGVQEETTVFGVPCLTVRENTERPITITEGTNTLVGLSADRLRDELQRALERPARARRPELWDGRAAERIVDALAAGVPEIRAPAAG